MKFISAILQGQNMRMFVKYIILAGFATLVDMGLLYSLTEFLYIWYLLSAAISYFIGMLVNYSLNKYLTFKNRSKRVIPQFGLFVVVASIGLGFNLLILFFLVEFMNLWYMFAKLIAIFIVMFWSFFAHKNLTFKVFK